MAKRPISFGISREIFGTIRDEADRRNLTISAVIEERSNPYSEFKRQNYHEK